MPKYLIEFPNHKATLVAEYNDEGNLISCTCNYGIMPKDLIASLHKWFPVDQANTLKRLSALKNVKATLIPDDISFEAFWTAYAHKVGNKTRSERIWNLLPNEDKIKALKFLQQYEQFLIMNPSTMKKYPETYLNQKPWDN